jgi:HK97 family phage portal protein
MADRRYEEIAGSGRVRVTTRSDVRLAKRQVEPLEGTLMSLWNTIIPNWWAENGLSSTANWTPGGASLAERVWVANRCQQLNAQQVSGMPLQWHGTPGTQEPAWVSSPDPNIFPNGIGDAMFAIVDQLYGWGWSLQYITDFYADGFPRTWTVIPSAMCEPKFDNGRRVYKVNDDFLDPTRIVQIDRNPTTAAHGTSALRAYAQQAWSLLAAGNQSMTVSQGGIPQAVLKSQRKLTKEQAENLQTQWMDRTQSRNGAPPVLPPEIDFSVLSINPADLALLDTQEWNARVIATAYGVPSVILNMALQGGLTYQNPLALMQMWWLTELRTTAKRIVDAFTAQMLPRGQWVSVDASDITTELDAGSAENDPQLSQVAKASPAQQPRPLQAIGGGA